MENLFKSVCRPSWNTTCNFNGLNDCDHDQCNCKPGYMGELCDTCKTTADKLCLVDNNEFSNGEIDMYTGEGVQCSCKCKQFWGNFYFVFFYHTSKF